MANIRKKAVLFTLGMVFLALSLLSLSFLIYQNSLSSREINYNSISSIRMQNIFSAAEFHLSKLFNSNSGIILVKNDSGISFRQNLDNDFSGFLTSVNNYNTVLKRVYGINSVINFNASQILFNITKDFQQTSNQIKYDVYSGTQNKTVVIFDEPSITSYKIYINSTDANGTVNWATVSPGNTNFVVIAVGQNGWVSSSERQLDTSSYSLIRITGLTNNFNITVGGGNATIRTDTSNLTLETMFNFSSAGNDVLLPINVIYNLSSSNVYRTYNPRIL